MLSLEHGKRRWIPGLALLLVVPGPSGCASRPAGEALVAPAKAPVAERPARPRSLARRSLRVRVPCPKPASLPAPELPEPFVQHELEDEHGNALWPFFTALRRSALGLSQTRIVFFGDSHSANDRLPGRVRAHLQAEFGYSGPGLVMPGKPKPWYRHSLVDVTRPRGFRAVSTLRTRHFEDRVGLGGFALRSRGRGKMRVASRPGAGAAAAASSFSLFFLRDPRGGTLEIELDGARAAVVEARGGEGELGIHRFSAPDGPHQIDLRAAGDGEVTVLGLALERDEPGVIVDTLGVVGARAREHLGWDAALYREQLTERQPDLIVLAYGTNEAASGRPLDDYERSLSRLLTRLREATPGAACLLVGPTDHPKRVGERYRPRARTAGVIDVQRRLASQYGCATFDLVAVTGGPLSMRRLVRGSPRYGAPDHVHFTRRGYDVLGDALSGALLRGYSEFLERACDPFGPTLASR